MGWKWAKVFEEGNRTMLVGTNYNTATGLTMQFMVRRGDKAQPCATLEHALSMFNQDQKSNIVVANSIPAAIQNGHLPIKKKSR